MNYTDPSGHCAGNANGAGNSHDENLCWASVHTIGKLWDDTDYWQQQWGSYDDFFANVGSHPLLGTDFFADELMRYFQSDQYKAWSASLPVSTVVSSLDLGDYSAFTATVLPTGIGNFGVKLIVDDYGNVYINLHISSMIEGSITRGDLNVARTSKPFDQVIPIDDVSSALREATMQQALVGASGGVSASAFFLGGSISISGGSTAHTTTEGGVALPGYSLSADVGRTFLIYDRNSATPWFWQ